MSRKIAESEAQQIGPALNCFWQSLHSRPILELQREYVETFDFSQKTTLHITYHPYGENKDESQNLRSEALLRLKNIYANSGYTLKTNELPDYLPALCEFASVGPLEAAQCILRETQNPIKTLLKNLKECNSRYADPVEVGLILMEEILSIPTVQEGGRR